MNPVLSIHYLPARRHHGLVWWYRELTILNYCPYMCALPIDNADASTSNSGWRGPSIHT